MRVIENFEDYRALVDEVKVHDYKYFALNAPTVSDEEYDAMYFALQEYEEAHTVIITAEGLVHNNQYGQVQNEVTLDDLFCV